MRIANRIFLILLIIIIPFTSIFAAMNLTWRLPDLYRYEFNRSEVTSEVNLSVSSDTLANFFSEYMLGKLDGFQLTAEYRGRERAVFGQGEASVMEQFRGVLNITFILLCVMFVAIILLYIYLLRNKHKEELRFAYKVGSIVYIAVMALFCIVLSIGSLREKIFDLGLAYSFGEDDILQEMLSVSFLHESLLAVTVISLILMVVGGSITWNLSKPERIFW